MARPADSLIVAAQLLVGAMAGGVPAMAAERQEISIAPGRLGEAIVALGRQTGTNIGMSDQSLAGISTPALRGRMSVESALDRLLKGSDASARQVDGRSWRIVRTRAAPRPPSRPTIAQAPLPEREQAEEIVVTASKRDVPLFRYAGMVESVGGSAFSSGEAATGTAALLSRFSSISSTNAGTGRSKLFIRAIADSGVAGPTQATTGQYLGDMRLNYAAPDPDLRLFDVAGVEVLEGPQGTLYGAGSLGGIIRILPNAPNLGETSMAGSIGASATWHGDTGADVAAVANLPIISEKLALRIVGYGVQEGGYIDDVTRGKDDVNRVRTWGGRAALRFAPDDAWTIDLNGVYQRIEARDAQYADRGKDLARASSVEQPYTSDYLLANLRIERQWDDLRLVSSTGYVRQILSESYDATQRNDPPALFRQRNHVDIFSTENRLVRDLDNGLGWIMGFSYLESTSAIRRSLTSYGTMASVPQIIPGVPLQGRGLAARTTGVKNRIKEATLFGEASFEPFTGLVATLGGRITNSRLSGEALDPVEVLPAFELASAEATAKTSETIFLPSFSLLSDAVPGTTVYARFQQGFRPGGLSVDDQRIQRFRRDRVSTLEVGFRSGRPGQDPFALSANAAFTDWKDIQADVTDRIGLPASANIGDGRIYTVEGRIVVRPLPRLTLDASAIYNDSRLTRPNAYVQRLAAADTSLTLPNVANLGGRLAFDYRTALGGDALPFHLSASARYVGKSRLGVGPWLGRMQGDYVDTSAAATVSLGTIALSISVINLLDSDGNRSALGTPFDLMSDVYTPQRPRTVRLGLDFAF
ncbi:MAG: TonB-dependent receptor [Sphingobium sp.]